MNIAAVSFDLDGTLYSAKALRRPLLWRTFPRWRTMRVGQRVREELRAERFVDGAALLQREAEIAAERLERDVESTKAALARVFDHDVTAVLARIGPRAGTRAMLQQLVANNIAIVVVSDRGAVDAKLAALGLGDLPWRAHVSADDVGVFKPNPLPFERAATSCGVAVGQLLHVGDRHDSDGDGARRAGCAGFVFVDDATSWSDVTSRVLPPAQGKHSR
jgi:putative hydrolase of the HAD superfamily